MYNIKKIILLLLALVLMACTSVSANEQLPVYPSEFATQEYWYEDSVPTVAFSGDFNVKQMLLMEYSTGRVLYALNENDRAPIASVTKIMSTILVMEAIDGGKIKYTDTVTVSANAASMGGSQVFLEPNEQMSVEDLLKALIVSSANDATVALAEHIYGSEESFIAAMNEKAVLLGMVNTHFVNTNGLDAPEHYSSAYDVALMTRELMKHPDVFKYTTIWMDTIRNGAFGLSNTNKLIRFYPDATGMKTGFTSAAGFCVSATAKRNGMQVIAVVLGGETSDIRFACAKKMMDYAFANYAITVPEPQMIENLSVVRGERESVPLKYEPVPILHEKGAGEISVKFEIPESIDAPVTEGDNLGVARFSIDGKEIASVPVTAAETVEKLSFFTLLWRILGCIKA